MKLEELFNKNYGKLSENDRDIWKYIADHRKECEALSIEELASRCHVSRTTILRFSQKLSLKGYSELKACIRMENNGAPPLHKSINRVIRSYAELIKYIRDRDCTNIFRIMDRADRLYVYGSGIVQSTVAKEIKRSFMNLGKIIYDIGANNESDCIAELITEADCIMIISLSGESAHVKNFVKKIKIKNVPIISITLMKDNTLAHTSDENLYIETSLTDSAYHVAYESMAGFFLLIDLLSLKYMEYEDIEKREEPAHDH